MSTSLIGSRYTLHLARRAREEAKHAASFAEVFASDEAPPDDPAVGYVHSIEIGSTVDGPGIRFVLFLTGCPLRCQYCHNPDTWHRLAGTPYPVRGVLRELTKYTEALATTGGGLTISGGEPVFQDRFMVQVMRQAKALGVHTCLDTSGRLGARLADDELELIDLQLLDIKSGDPDTYRKVTGHPLEPTLAYARRLSELRRPLWVRFVLVPGLTDAVDNVERIADVCVGLESLERVEILRFHQMGKAKYDKLKIPYPLADTEPPTAELTERVREQFRRRGLTVF